MAKQSDNLLFFDTTSGQATLIGSNSVSLSSSLEVGGNLTVHGTMTYIDSEILTSDAYLLMNSSYSGITAQNGGLVINAKMNAAPGNLISVTATTNTVVISGVHNVSDGDVFSIQNTSDSANDSLYEVASATNNGVNTTVVLKAVVTSSYDELLRSSSDLVDEGNTSGAKAGKATIAVFRSDVASSRFEYAIGDNTTMAFQDIAASNLALQTAYQNGNTISLSAADGALDVSPAVGEVVAISLDASAPSNFSTSGNNALTLSTDAGNLLLSSSTGNINASVPNTAEVKLLSGASEGANDVFGRALIDGNSVSLLANGAGAFLNLGSHGNISLNTSGGDVTLAATGGTGKVTVATLADISLLSGANIDALAPGDISLTAGNAGDAGGALTAVAKGGALTIQTSADGDGDIGQLVIDANQTGGTALTIGSAGAMTTDVADGAYAVTTTKTGTASPISLLATDDAISVTAGTDISVVSTGTTRDVLISSVGTTAGGYSEKGSGGELIMHTDSLSMNSALFTLDATDVNALGGTGSITTDGLLSLSASAGDITLTTPNTQDIKVTSGDDTNAANVYGQLLVDGNQVTLNANGAAADLFLLSGADTSLSSSNDTTLTVGGDLSMDVQASASLTTTSGNIVLTSGADASLTTSGDITLTAEATALDQANLTIATSDNGNTSGTLAINAARAGQFVTTNGALTLQSNNGDLAIQALNGGVASAISLTTNTNDITITSGADVSVSSSATGSVSVGAGSAAAGTGSVGVTTNALTATTGTASLTGSTSVSISATAAANNNATLALSADASASLTGGSTATVTAPAVSLVGNDSLTSQQISLKNSDSDSVIEVESDAAFKGARLNQSVSVGSQLSNIAAVSDVGVGLRVTVEASVEIGNILAVNANGRFDKGLARVANAGDSELPQNPIGVALANGAAGSTTSDVFMSTVSGATVLVQLTAAPGAGDVGKVVYLSPTVAGKGVMPAVPSDLIAGDGLTRVTQIGYLLSSTAVVITGVGGGNVNVYPVIWILDQRGDG